MLKPSFAEARFALDCELLAQIQAEAELKLLMQRTEVLRKRSLTRARMLSGAVGVNERLTPDLAASVARVGRYLGAEVPLEAYVFASADINAFVARGSQRHLVAVSSAAVNVLSATELDCLIGHEMGHLMYGHTDVCVEAMLEAGGVTPAQCRLLRSWERAAEISADRAGLAFCGSLQVAANALFKSVSGLGLAGLQVDPAEFSAQWSTLAEELMDHGGREYWQLAHPFPPLRMRAMQLFWEGAGDEEIRRLLGMMEDAPAPRQGGSDPLLGRFNFWGGLYVILADGSPTTVEIEHLAALLPPGLSLEQALSEGGRCPDSCLEHFAEARQNRKTKLSSGELHHIVQGLVAAAAVDGPLKEAERLHLHRLGEALGLRPEALELVMERLAKDEGGTLKC